MRKITMILAVMCLFSLTACGPSMIAKHNAYPLMYEEKPLAVLVVSPINQSTAADAVELYNSTIAAPLTLKGYYVFPIEVVTEILKAEGLPDSDLLLNVPPQRFREYFGADAVLFVSINKWDTAYYVVGGNVTVSLAYTMKSTETGEILWLYSDTLKVDTSAPNRGGGVAGLVLQAVETAVETAMTDYVPIARRLNTMSLTNMPAGSYHPRHGQDRDEMLPIARTK